MVCAMFDAAFLKGETWGFPGAPVEHVETHAAYVFLVNNRAFKVKKAVKLPYLDFSTPEKRKAVLEDELAINRVYAPELYLNVTEVRGEPVLVMRRFAAQALLSWRVAHHTLDDEIARELAETAAAAHGLAPRRDTPPGADIMLGLGAQISQAYTNAADIFPAADTLEFHALYEEALHRFRTLLNRRGLEGLVRRCHGDMHCGNIIVEDGKPVLFDAIEFSEKIATIDVLYDLAFLLMDLWRHGERRAANIVLNRYLHLRRSEENLSGLALLPLFLSTRAGVRALVTADLMHELTVSRSLKLRGDALDYFRASIAYLKPSRPRLICIGGFSGTGKSTLAARLAPDIGAVPGALHLRSDLERKHQAGIGEFERLPNESYTPAAAAAVYHVLLERAEAALKAGHAVILDAVFASDAERRMAAALALRLGVRFDGLWLKADPAVLKARVAARRNDASDATPDIVDRQLGYDLGTLNWLRVDASGGAAETLNSVRRLVLSSSAAAQRREPPKPPGSGG